MSWDFSLFDAPVGLKSNELPQDFRPRLFARDQLISTIKQAFPNVDFRDSSWGFIEGIGWSIEVNIGSEEMTHGFMLHVRGGGDVIAAVLRIADATGLRALDCQTGDFVDKSTAEAANASFRAWRNYRDQIVGRRGFWTRVRAWFS